jgi:hypothetical protein
VISLFGKKPSKRDEARNTAKAEYEEALNADVTSRAGRALVVRAGARAKAHIDKTFISGADKAVAYDTARALAISRGEDRPEPPRAEPYQTIKSVKGDLVVFLPSHFAEKVFRAGMQYQLVEITAEQAVEVVQEVADIVSRELQLEQPFVALEFLRAELEKEAAEQGAPDESSVPAEGSVPEAASGQRPDGGEPGR